MEAQGLKRSEVVGKNGVAGRKLKRLDRQLRQALLLCDTKALSDLIADDYTFTNPLGDVANKSLLMTGIDSALVLYSVDTKNVKVCVYGDTASVSGNATVVGQYNKQAINGQYRYSDVYMKRDGRWQVVATQAVCVERR